MHTLNRSLLARVTATLALSFATLGAQTLTWTQRNTGVSAGFQYEAGVYGGGKFVVLAYGMAPNSTSVFQTQAAVSADGITWTTNTLPTNPVCRGVGYGNGLFAAAVERNGADSGNTQNILTSPDGSTWTARTTGAGTLNAVAYSGTRWVAVGAQNSGQNAATSADGLTWTRAAVGNGSTNLNGIVSNNLVGNFVAWSGSSADLYVTANGTTWNRASLPGATASSRLWGVTVAGNTYVAAIQAGFTGTTAQLFTSPDGTIWTAAGTINYPAGFTNSGTTSLALSAAPASGNAVVVGIGATFDANFNSVARVVVSSGALTAWGAQQFGTGSFVENRFVIFGNGLFVVGNSTTQLFTAPSSVTGGGTGGGTGPTITAQPTNETAAVGNSIGFSVTASGTGNTYQWLFNGNVIAGATSSIYTIPNVTTASAGSYTVRVTNTSGTTTSNAATLTVTGGANGTPGGGSAGAYLSNLSIRTNAGSGAQTLIVGLNIGGAGTSGTKNVLIRGIGPALTGFGVSGALADPQLTVYNGQVVADSNDNWNATSTPLATQTGVGAFALTPGSKDAALIGANVPAGSYSVQITGVGGTTGIALAEIYDLTPASSFSATTPRLANISARSQVGTGGDILITGFNISGTGTRRLLIRGIGPTLGAFGVTGTLADPKLEIYNSANALVGSNDNWDATATPNATQTAAGGFALTANSKDAAVIVNLAPGTYTAQVSGVGGTTGVGLVEIYELP